jgi:SAM-dependent methyltransferase
VSARYDTIGRTYTATRRPDPRVAARIDAALGDARTVLNVGAGTGSYEPREREVTAVEPSATMRAQRPPDAAPCVAAQAEDLPFAGASFDAVLAILTLHHWGDWRAGAAECLRVARDHVVVFTWDPAAAARLWLGPEYFPGLWADDVARFPSLDEQAHAFAAERIEVVAIPHDCSDGFMGAHWRRPAAYLNPAVRDGISTFALRTPAQLEPGLRALEDDLATGVWAARHADLLERDELDLGYRLLVGTPSQAPLS